MLRVTKGVTVALLTARFGGDDVGLLRRVLGNQADGPGLAAPDRVVIDAHLPLRTPEIAQLTRVAGVPLLIDPQTYYLQDWQHSADPWALLPFATAGQRTPADLLSSRGELDALVADCIDFQLEHGATTLLAPYVHIEAAGNGWLQVQLAMWEATARYLTTLDQRLPVIAVVAVGWRLLHRPNWPAALEPLATGAEALGAAEIALAASKVDQGTQPAARLSDYLATISRLRRVAPVTAWNQGVLGDVSIAGGAAGYETGIARRERCDLQTKMKDHRKAIDPSKPRGPRGVFIPQLNRTLPKRSVEAISDDRRLVPRLICPSSDCCPTGRDALLQDARAHALTSRRTSLIDQERVSRPSWGWNRLAAHADLALDLAARINAAGQYVPAITRVNTGALQATKVVADHHRQALRLRRAA